MNTVTILIGLCFFILFYFLKISFKFKIIIPVLCILLVIFLRALGMIHVFLLFATVIYTILLSFIFSQILRHPDNASSDPITKRRSAFLVRILIFFMSIIAIHNLIDINRFMDDQNKILIQDISPWGIFTNCAILLYFVKVFSNRDITPEIYRILMRIVVAASIILAVLGIAVHFGFIPGNTQKVHLGIGGIGLANLSTNESGLFAVCLLLWNMKFIFDRTANRLLLLTASFLNVFMIVLSKSRISLILVIFLFVIAFLSWKTRRFLKLVILVTILIVLLIVVGRVFNERNSGDVSARPRSAIATENLLGSGRVTIWVTYLDAFVYTARQKTSVWFLGTGMMGLSDLYSLTPLSKIKAVKLFLDNCHFYPLHSDLITIFLMSGIFGTVFWILHFFLIISIPKRLGYSFQSIGAVLILIVFSTFDMLNYFPLAAIFLYLAIVDSIRLGDIQFQQIT